jgi:PadR family transcriptional regulator PadR
MNLLSYQWIESTQGPPRKYYKLTEEGKNFLTELGAAWEEVSDTINHLKNL